VLSSIHVTVLTIDHPLVFEPWNRAAVLHHQQTKPDKTIMKKALKIFGWILLAIITLIALFLAYIQIKGIPDYPYAPTPEIQNLQVPRDSALIARGAAIGQMHCVACHAAPDGALVGKPITDLPPIFGKINSLNITRDSVHGIGAWTDGELYYLLRTGIHSDQRWSPPFMPKYDRMADQDIHSVIAWLRSDEPRLKPDAREYPPNQFNLFIKLLCNTMFTPPPLQTQPITIPDTNNIVAFGAYVANGLGDCYACHCADILAVAPIPEESKGFYGGGTVLSTESGQPIRSANITMDKETGIGNWTEQQFVEAVRFGKKPHGGTLSYPMLPRPTLTEQEVKAIFQYLKTVPVIKNPVERFSGE
jgi:mono/diheme cytochrome c family protein